MTMGSSCGAVARLVVLALAIQVVSSWVCGIDNRVGTLRRVGVAESARGGGRCASSGATPRLAMACDHTVDAVVIGSGVSGSCHAFHLARNHGVNDMLLCERNSVVGGNCISKSNDEGFLWEEGPNSFQPTPGVMQTVAELGISDDLVLADGTLPRFVYWEGVLHALPTNLPQDLLTFFLLSWPGKIRAGLGAIGLIKPPPPAPYEESVREFVTRHLGPEAFEKLIDPFVSGVYAGDPDSLAIRAALKKIYRLEGLGDFGPGLVSGAIRRFQEIAEEKQDNPPDPSWPTYKSGELGSFRRGLQTLPNAVAEYLGADRVKTSWTVRTVEKGPEGDGRYVVTFDTPEGSKTVSAKAVMMTAPTRVACEVAKDLIPAAAALEKVYSPPVASVTMAYPKSSFRNLPGSSPQRPLRGFGHLLPRKMKIRSLGTIWSSSLFPGRAPEGYELLLTYIGGARDRGIVDLSEDEIYEQVDADNHKVLLKEDAPPGKRIGLKLWQAAIPQYERGHLDLLEALDADEAKVPGFFLGGNYRTGVAFGDCVQFGIDSAAKVASYLKAEAGPGKGTAVAGTVRSPMEGERA